MTGPSDRSPLRVLVADDDATTRTLYASMIRSMGHAVHVAGDGLQALAIFETTRPEVMVVDWLMPKIDGLEFVRRVRSAVGDECFIILVTARHSAVDLEDALAAGVDDYSTKPVSAGQFRARIMIAERRLAQVRARREAENDASRLRWLAGIGQTVFTLQHEINNPLTALYGCLEMIDSAPELSARTKEDVERARHQARRIADVVQRISNIERHATVELLPGFPMLDIGPSAMDEAPSSADTE